jgi:hypothetical protein
MGRTQIMWGFLGCAGPLAFVGFVLGFIGTFLADPMTLELRFAMAGMTAAMVFVAATLLCISDMQKRNAALRRVRKLLDGRPPISDVEFVAALPDVDADLSVQVRHAIARYLAVSPGTIYPTDSPSRDLGAVELQPGFHFAVVAEIIQTRDLSTAGFHFDGSHYSTMSRFIDEVERALAEAVNNAPQTG